MQNAPPCDAAYLLLSVNLCVCAQFRLAFAYVSAFGGQLSWKERAYVTIAGFPKATVQVSSYVQ